MKIEQLKKVSIKKVKSKPFMESVGEEIKEMTDSDIDAFTFTIEDGKIVTWKPFEVDVPEAVHRELSELFNGNEEVIEKWLNTPKPFLQSKAPIEILDTDCGLASILDLIERLRTGDIS
ncbi:MAG: MbcA/ParS/Xre antitoxin family protein [Colwellia sp.]|nr:MbcA/ParS/Xre antitoxin family protein [Colwellia sp.]